jgi:hypothetical protein
MRLALLVAAIVMGGACSSHEPQAAAPPAPAPAPVVIDAAPAPVVIATAPDAAPVVIDAAPVVIDAAPPPDAAPPSKPVRSSSSDPTACSSSAECEVHCPVAAGCCDPAPCGCTETINRAREKAVDRAYAKICERKRCPIVDCKFIQPMGAACVDGHCVPTGGPSSRDPF